LYFGIVYSTFYNQDKEWIPGYNQIYAILVTESKLVLQHARFKLLADNNNFVENFAIVFPSAITSHLNVCVAQRTQTADLSEMDCQKFVPTENPLITVINQG
jgi:hypothetical protein